MGHPDKSAVHEGELIQIVSSAEHVIDPIRNYPAIRPRLREIATELKHLDGEHWAVGEMLRRACLYLDACEATMDADMEAEASAERGREEAGATEQYAATHPEDRGASA
jgi:hypothetical protein